MTNDVDTTQLSKSVGIGGVNASADVRTIQKLLNKNRLHIPDAREIVVDGHLGPVTVDAIRNFQLFVVKLSHPDARVDPGGKTWMALSHPVKSKEPGRADPAPAPAVGPILLRPIRFPLRSRPKDNYCGTHKASRYFGAPRNSEKPKGSGRVIYRAHAGCDLIAMAGTEILAIDGGSVIDISTHFYTSKKFKRVVGAIAVKHDNGMVARYCEIREVASGVSLAHPRVERGQVIAYVGLLDHNPSMLHFEMYNGSLKGHLSQDGNVFQRRGDLIDPTNYLNSAVLA